MIGQTLGHYRILEEIGSGRSKPIGQKLSLLILPLLLSMFSVSLPAQETGEHSWENLQQVRVGQKIEVVDTNLKKLKGTFLSFSGEAISLRVGKDEVGVQRPNVLRVSLRGRPKRSTSAIVGAAIGALVGVGVGALAATRYGSGDPGSESFIVFLGTTIGAGAGAGVGAAVPFVPSYRTIYRAKGKRAPASNPSSAVWTCRSSCRVVLPGEAA